MMPEKYQPIIDFLKEAFPFFTTFVLSIWGGTVSHIQRLRKSKRKFTFGPEYVMDIVICSFAGLLTYFFCMYANIDGWLQAILISISAHMGTRAIASFESLHNRIFNWKDSQ